MAPECPLWIANYFRVGRPMVFMPVAIGFDRVYGSRVKSARVANYFRVGCPRVFMPVNFLYRPILR